MHTPLMSSRGYYIGVDGCRGGWVDVALRGGRSPELRVFGCLSDLWQAHKDADIILIDMPIGLYGHKPGDPGSHLSDSGRSPSCDANLAPGRNGLQVPYPRERDCDTAARAVLNGRGNVRLDRRTTTVGGKRGCSVFPVPSREAVWCSDIDPAEVNERLTGRKLACQTKGILPKIRELDALLLSCGRARQVFKESHPELLFCEMNGGVPMRYRKKCREGVAERKSLLAGVAGRALLEHALEDGRQYRRRELQEDDVLDALACAVAASHPDELASLPESPPLDACGLPMQMLYWRRPVESARSG
jgi:predicted RNase H-like nuclease